MKRLWIKLKLHTMTDRLEFFRRPDAARRIQLRRPNGTPKTSHSQTRQVQTFLVTILLTQSHLFDRTVMTLLPKNHLATKLLICALFCCLQFLSTEATAQTTETTKETAEETTVDEHEFQMEPGFESLYNGKDLTGWSYLPTTQQQKKSRARWQKNNKDAPPWPIVESTIDFSGKPQTDDGRFVAEGENLVVTVPEEGRKIQNLNTLREFDTDFILRLEFRAANKADSGVFIRGKQLQCRDYPNAGPYKDLKNFNAEDWNTLEIVVTGTTAKCTCNGEVLEEALAIPESGPIGVEGDQGKLEYRRIRIADGKLKPTNKLSSWRFQELENGKGSMKVDGDAIEFTTTETGTENWHVQAYQTRLNLEEGASYQVSFEMSASDSQLVHLMAQIDQEDWGNLGLHEEIYAGKEFQEYSFKFTPTNTVQGNNRIGFVFGEDIGTVKVKNFKLERE